jgi:hypothetical protein
MSVYNNLTPITRKDDLPDKLGNTNDDDWDTDPDYVNDVGEKGQRFGSKLIRNDDIEVTNVAEVREKAIQQDSQVGMDQYWNSKQKKNTN